jgi:1-acyl-sn-glycerol-3-phosphate acyltransferase
MPSVSSVLRLDGSALVDRKDPHQAIAAVKGLGKRVESNGWTACIFPEGTRSRDGKVRSFKPAGLLALLAETPHAAVVPVTIDGSWELMRYNFFPVPWGVRVTLRIHPALSRGGDDKAVVAAVEGLIRRELDPSHRSVAPAERPAQAF